MEATGAVAVVVVAAFEDVAYRPYSFITLPAITSLWISEVP